jgi:SIR2-like domain
MRPTANHYRFVADAMLRGKVVPLIGAGVNNCGRPGDWRWAPARQEYLPDGRELAEYLAGEFYYGEPDRADLVRVSQYVALKAGAGPLYELLHDVFDVDCLPSPLHRLLARLPAMIRDAAPSAPRFPVFMTTNYDDILERALVAAGEEFDVLSYIAESDQRGKFSHRAWDAPHGDVIDSPNEYDGVSLDERPVILKVHGSVDRTDVTSDSYVMTENHFLDYLGNTDIAGFLPAPVAPALQRSHFLFLGYRLRDWNLRVILHRIWGRQSLRYASWSIQREPPELDRCFWEQRGVEVLEESLDDYTPHLAAALEERTAAAVSRG